LPFIADFSLYPINNYCFDVWVEQIGFFTIVLNILSVIIIPNFERWGI